MNIHSMVGQAFEDQWELLDVLDTFDAEYYRDAFDTVCRCESDGCERGEQVPS